MFYPNSCYLAFLAVAFFFFTEGLACGTELGAAAASSSERLIEDTSVMTVQVLRLEIGAHS